MVCGSGGSTTGFAKAAGAESYGQMKKEKLNAVVESVKQNCLQPLLDLEMSKKGMPVWQCEAHLEVKSVQNWLFRTTFGSWDVVKVAHFPVNVLNTQHARTTLKLQMWFCVAGARNSAPCQTWAKPGGLVAVLTSSTIKLHSAPLQYTTLHYHYHYNCVTPH